MWSRTTTQSAAGSAVVTSSGVPDKDLWEQAVLRGMKRMTKGERKVCLSYEERATPGCVCVGDVVLYKHEDRSLRLALVLRIREDRVEVQRLKRRTSATKEVAEGQQAAVDTHAGKYVAAVLKRL